MIEAMRFAVEDVAENGEPLWAPPNEQIVDAIWEWQFSHSVPVSLRAQWHPSQNRLLIPTPEGVMEALPGDWIIRGVKGEFYPIKADIFAATYELEESASVPTEL